MKPTINNKRMGLLLEKAVAQVSIITKEREDDILKAWMENIEEAQSNEMDKLPPLKLSFTVNIDLEKNTIGSALRFTTAYTSSICESIPDPNQAELEI